MSNMNRKFQNNDTAVKESLVHNLIPRKVYDIPNKTNSRLVIEEMPVETTDEDLENDKNLHQSVSGFQADDQDGAGRKRREVTLQMLEHTVETLVVADRKMFEFHESESLLQPYVLTILNIVSLPRL